METYIVNRPAFDVDNILSFLKREGMSWRRSEDARPAEELVEIGGRICYLSFGVNQSNATNSEFVKRLIESKHETVLEHVSWSFLITGISRALTHQLVRQRVGFSFSQLSQEYHDETDNEPIEPQIIEDNPQIRKVWQNAVQTSKDAYRQILNLLTESKTFNDPSKNKKEQRQMARSIARSVLTNATETKILVTANARAWRHFFEVRGSSPHNEEMRHLAA